MRGRWEEKRRDAVRIQEGWVKSKFNQRGKDSGVVLLHILKQRSKEENLRWK